MPVLPIHLCVDESKFSERPAPLAAKTQGFSSLVPGDVSTYVYDTEEAYYQQYAQSYYALTKKKAGWDCLRHWEIVAAGCVPYFVGLDKCPPNILTRFPKALVWEAMHLPGVDAASRTIDFTVFPVERYQDLRDAIFEAVKSEATCRGMATYLLRSVGVPAPTRVLFLSSSAFPDYQRCTLLTGLKRVLGPSVFDHIRVDHLYADYPPEAAARLYGRGFSYARVLPPAEAEPPPHLPADAVALLLERGVFDLVVYGSVHRGTPLLDKVRATLPPERIVFVCGEDDHDTRSCRSFVHSNSWLFVRELV